MDYLRIEHEEGIDQGVSPPAYWPASGSLRVEKLSAKYSDGREKLFITRYLILITNLYIESPEVLKEINFEVKTGERIGVGEFSHTFSAS